MLRTKRGELTAQAYNCGYIDRRELGDYAVILDRPSPTSNYRVTLSPPSIEFDPVYFHTPHLKEARRVRDKLTRSPDYGIACGNLITEHYKRPTS